jgi:hypothetical protein
MHGVVGSFGRNEGRVLCAAQDRFSCASQGKRHRKGQRLVRSTRSNRATNSEVASVSRGGHPLHGREPLACPTRSGNNFKVDDRPTGLHPRNVADTSLGGSLPCLPESCSAALSPHRAGPAAKQHVDHVRSPYQSPKMGTHSFCSTALRCVLHSLRHRIPIE